MFEYNGKFKGWLIYSCPWRVILLSPAATVNRKQTLVVLFTMRNNSRFGGKAIYKTTYIIQGNVIKNKIPTLRYIIPVLGRIIDGRYNRIEDLAVKFEYGADLNRIIEPWEDNILRSVGFYGEQKNKGRLDD